MILKGERIYLGGLTKEAIRYVFQHSEVDLDFITEEASIGHTEFSADAYYETVSKNQGDTFVRLGIYLEDQIIGTIGLQEIDWKSRSCSLGMSFIKIKDRNKGYGQEAAKLMLAYGFKSLGLERISANTLSHNLPARKSLEKVGFVQEGIERKAVYLAGKKYDRYLYGMLIEDFKI